MNRNTLIGLLAIVVIIGGILYYLNNSAGEPDFLSQQGTSTPVTMGTEATSTPATGGSTTTGTGLNASVQTVTVTYTDQGFSPTTITIKRGSKVRFVNATSESMWVASDQHPTHTAYSGTSRTEHCPDTAGTAFDQCAAGNSFTFTFNKVGSWKYHNHSESDEGGTIIVTQ